MRVASFFLPGKTGFHLTGPRRFPARGLLALAVALAVGTPSHAEESGLQEQLVPVALAGFERMSVVGSRQAGNDIGGAASIVLPEDIAQFRHADVMRVLRQVPGVYVVEEEGLGLRPNIGIRGSGLDRNARITVMEDGVLIAPAAYAAPSAYYFPTMQRMSALEIRKGSASVRSGPRTTGGAINLVSTPIPDAALAGHVNLMGGEDETLLGHAHVGGSRGQWGFLLEGVRQQTDGFKDIDGGGNAGYELDDLLGKLRFSTEPGAGLPQTFELKVGVTNQLADETYMGLTDADFAADPDRRYAASRLDNIDAEHHQLELRHLVELTPALDLTTVLYRHDFARNWYKAEQAGGLSLDAILTDPVTHATEYGWLTGETSPDDAIVIRNNRRKYDAEGVQSILAWAPDAMGPLTHEVELGLRYHVDDEDRFQDNDRYRMEDGRLILTTDGEPGSQDNRVGRARALAGYLQYSARFGRWSVVPGIRYEHIELEQTRWSTTDPDRTLPSSRRLATVSELIPGVGAVYRLNDDWALVGGVHKGFNPPAPGSTSDPEESVNYELGFRYGNGIVNGEVIGFFNDYHNLVGTCTESTGGGCAIGDQYDGGKVRMHGLEVAGTAELSLTSSIRLPLKLSYTWTAAEFRSDFSSEFGEWGAVESGDELPYLPPHQVQVGAGLEADQWSVNLTANWVDEMRVTAGQGSIPADESTDARWVVDLAGSRALTDEVRLFARIENLLDETYVAARRPAGVRPGRPRTALVGIVFDF